MQAVEYRVAVRNGVEVINVDLDNGAVSTYAGRIYQGASGRWEVEPSQFTSALMAEGQFDDLPAAKRYVEKCLKGAEDVQTTEQEVNQARKSTKGMGDTGKAALEARRAEPRPMTSDPKPEKAVKESRKRQASLAEQEAAASAVYGDQAKAPGKQRQRKTSSQKQTDTIVAAANQTPVARQKQPGNASQASSQKTQAVDLNAKQDHTCRQCGATAHGSVHQIFKQGWRGPRPGGWGSPLCGVCTGKGK
jgi:hypothetical protein